MQKFDLILQIGIQEHYENGVGNYNGNRLEVRETCTIQAKTFLEVALIVGQFHELAKTLEARTFEVTK